MQTLIKTTLAAALSIAAISPALADEQQIVVHSQSAMEEWQESVTHSLDRRLLTAKRQTRFTPTSGIVQLRFTLDADGAPQEFDFVSSTGDKRTDRIAKRAVSRLTQLDEAPVNNASAQTYQANIIFADSVEEHAKLAKKLAKKERAARLALGDSDTNVISFGL